MSSEFAKFRSSLSGYKKEDVNQFILELNRAKVNSDKQYSEALKQRDDRIADLSGKITELESKLFSAKEAETKAKGLEAELIAFKDTLAEHDEQANASSFTLEERCKQLETQLGAAKEELLECKALIGAQTDKIEALEEQLNEKPSGPIEEPGNFAGKVGKVFLSANHSADQIMDDAENTAELIKMSAVEEANTIRKNARRIVEQNIADVNMLIKKSVEAYFSSCRENYSGLGTEIENCIAQHEKTMKEKADILEKCISEKIMIANISDKK